VLIVGRRREIQRKGGRGKENKVRGTGKQYTVLMIRSSYQLGGCSWMDSDERSLSGADAEVQDAMAQCVSGQSRVSAGTTRSQGGMCLRAVRQMDLVNPGDVGRIESEGV
jgi:hypothetical protein